MQFLSVGFLLFAALLLLIYYLIPGKIQWVLLLAASYAFYLWAGIDYLLFILLTTGSTWLTTAYIARELEKQEKYLALNKSVLTREEKKAYKATVKKRCKLPMLICLVLNFSILALCKCCIVDPFSSAVQEGCLSFLTLGLPLGISFYMFQSMGYVLDVYRGSVKAEKNPLKLALFVSYFPQLIQGPISKYSQLAPQLCTAHKFDGKQFSFGLQRVLWGYFKKLVVADRIAVAVIALRGPEYTGVGFFLLTIFYAVQIYADFTGGIDMVLGLSHTLGIRLTENFHRPFFSKNVAEYWRRWHISLGEWMKNYIFNPISVSSAMLKFGKRTRTKFGNFGKRLPIYVASFATWFVTGIWHGITPNFILWGMMNCLIIVISEELEPVYKSFHNRFHLKEKAWYSGFEMLRTFILMNLIRIVDFFPNLGDYFRRMGSLITTFNLHILWDGTMLSLGLTGLDYGILMFACTVMLTVSLIEEKKGSILEFLWNKDILRYVLVFTLLVVTLLLGRYGIGYNASNFIYNQF